MPESTRRFPRSQAAIVGIGCTEFSRNSGVSTFALAARAVKAAVEDAGLSLNDIDGLATYSVNDSIAPNFLAQALGIRDLSYYVDQLGGGAVSQAVIGQAALAVSAGVADCIVLYRALNARSGLRLGATGQAVLPFWDAQFKAPIGYVAPAQEFGMAARTHMLKYGTTAEDFGRIAVLSRENAVDNERAMMRTPMTMDDYLATRYIAEPFRMADCCLETDGAVALVVVPAERAKDLRRQPVFVRGAAWGGGTTVINTGPVDLSVSPAAALSKKLYNAAGLGPTEVDFAELYDCFTYAVLVQLEDYGFAEKGSVPSLLVDDTFARASGSLPINTHGGFLSEGYIHGLNHVYEAVQQIRGDAGRRQVARHDVALVTGAPGYRIGYTSAVVLAGSQ